MNSARRIERLVEEPRVASWCYGPAVPPRSVSLLAALALIAACDEKGKAREPSAAAPSTTAPSTDCPPGTELLGAPPPRGQGLWCQRITGGQAEIFHPGGALWARGAMSDAGMEGTWEFFAADGRVARTRAYEKGHSAGPPNVLIADVELPPTIAP